MSPRPLQCRGRALEADTSTNLLVLPPPALPLRFLPLLLPPPVLPLVHPVHPAHPTHPAHHPAIDLTLAEGARGVGGQRTALVLPLQPRLHPPVSPPVSAPDCSRYRLPSLPTVIRLRESSETGQSSGMQGTRDSPLRTESETRNSRSRPLIVWTRFMCDYSTSREYM